MGGGEQRARIGESHLGVVAGKLRQVAEGGLRQEGRDRRVRESGIGRRGPGICPRHCRLMPGEGP